MNRLDPLITGASLAITIAIAYLVCALFFQMFPTLASPFLQSLFHGVEFVAGTGSGAPGPVTFALTDLALAAYAFFVGWLFAQVRNRLGRA